MKPWSWGKCMKKLFVKTNKNNGVCEIYYAGEKSNSTPDELKPTLNMFRGQRFPECFKDLLNYAKLSLDAQNGDVEARKELDRIHYELNN